MLTSFFSSPFPSPSPHLSPPFCELVFEGRGTLFLQRSTRAIFSSHIPLLSSPNLLWPFCSFLITIQPSANLYPAYSPPPLVVTVLFCFVSHSPLVLSKKTGEKRGREGAGCGELSSPRASPIISILLFCANVVWRSGRTKKVGRILRRFQEGEGCVDSDKPGTA